MAIDQGNVTTTANKVDRGWRIEFAIGEDESVYITMYREMRAKDTTTGEIVSRDRTTIPPVQRNAADIKTKTYTGGGITATGQQIMQLLNKMSDTERQVDIDRQVIPAAPPVL